jgi:adenylate cyclase
MASGRVLNRFGDVYGSVVNLAARLTSVARPGTILIDRELATELAEEPAYELRQRRPVTVRGYNRLRPSALRRAREVPTGVFASSQQLAAEMLGLTEPGAPEPVDEENGKRDETTSAPRSRRRRRRIL